MVSGRLRHAGELIQEHGLGRILERQQHAGDIAQRRSFDPAAAQGAIGGAVKTDEHEILAGVQHAVQPEIVVQAGAQRVDAAFGDQARASTNIPRGVQTLFARRSALKPAATSGAAARAERFRWTGPSSRERWHGGNGP